MAIPVLPNTRHPSRRPPLDPGVPLPWNRCSISPLVVTWAKVAPAAAVLDSHPTHMTTPAEHKRVRSLMDADVDMWNMMGRGKVQRPHRSLRRSPRRRLKLEDDPFKLWRSETTVAASDSQDTSDDDESFYTAKTSLDSTDDDGVLLEYVCSSVQRRVDALRLHAVNIGVQKAAMEPIINITSDLSTVQKPCPPQQYFWEWEFLQKSVEHLLD